MTSESPSPFRIQLGACETASEANVRVTRITGLPPKEWGQPIRNPAVKEYGYTSYPTRRGGGPIQTVSVNGMNELVYAAIYATDVEAVQSEPCEIDVEIDGDVRTLVPDLGMTMKDGKIVLVSLCYLDDIDLLRRTFMTISKGVKRISRSASYLALASGFADSAMASNAKEHWQWNRGEGNRVLGDEFAAPVLDAIKGSKRDAVTSAKAVKAVIDAGLADREGIPIMGGTPEGRAEVILRVLQHEGRIDIDWAKPFREGTGVGLPDTYASSRKIMPLLKEYGYFGIW